MLNNAKIFSFMQIFVFKKGEKRILGSPDSIKKFYIYNQLRKNEMI